MSMTNPPSPAAVAAHQLMQDFIGYIGGEHGYYPRNLSELADAVESFLIARGPSASSAIPSPTPSTILVSQRGLSEAMFSVMASYFNHPGSDLQFSVTDATTDTWAADVWEILASRVATGKGE